MEPTKGERAVCRVIEGRRMVARQHGVVEKLARKGLDTTEAENTLDLFIGTLRIFEDELRTILGQDPLCAAPSPVPRSPACRADGITLSAAIFQKPQARAEHNTQFRVGTDARVYVALRKFPGKERVREQ